MSFTHLIQNIHASSYFTVEQNISTEISSGIFAFINSPLTTYPNWFILPLIIFLLIIIFVLVRKNYKLRELHEKENIEELRQSEERFRKLTALTFEGIVIHRSGIVLDCNEAFLNIVGYDRKEIIKSNVVEKCIYKEDIPIVLKNVQSNLTLPYEVRGIRKNGEVFQVEIESREVKYGDTVARVAAVRDMTERNKQKELVKKEQWMLNTLMYNIPDSIFFKDLQSKFIRVNKSTLNKFNVADENELIGKSDFDFFDEEHAKPAFDDEQEIIRTRKPVINKIEKETWKDGTINWASTSKLPLINVNGEVVGTFGMTRDVTELKNAQDNLIAQKEKFEQLLRLVPSAVFTVDIDKKITSWNSMAEELTGYSVNEVLNKECSFFAGEPCINNCGLYNDKADKPIVNKECIIKKKDGSNIIVSKNVDFIRDAEGNVVGGIESFVDISERKRYEDEIKNYSDELSDLNKSKDRFFSIIAHDLRNPFITLLGFSEMLIEDYNDFTDDEKISYLKEMEKSARSSYQLLENLLQWSRAQTGNIKYFPQEINAVDILKENFTLLDKSAEMKKIKLINGLSAGEFVMADYDMLTTIFRNLITNALKFTPKGGSISVYAKDQNKMIEFEVRDTGVGISPERLKSIFRIDESSSTVGTDGEKGSGLGLVLSKEFVEKHNGLIRIESEEGKGTSFFFTLPKSQPV